MAARVKIIFCHPRFQKKVFFYFGLSCSLILNVRYGNWFKTKSIGTSYLKKKTCTSVMTNELSCIFKLETVLLKTSSVSATFTFFGKFCFCAIVTLLETETSMFSKIIYYQKQMLELNCWKTFPFLSYIIYYNSSSAFCMFLANGHLFFNLFYTFWR